MLPLLEIIVADIAETTAEPTGTVEAVAPSSNSGPTSLSQYATEVEAITGERVTNDIEPDAESANEPDSGEKETSKEEPSKGPESVKAPAKAPPKPQPFEFNEEHFKDPRVQSEIDRRAAALERNRRSESEARVAEEARQKAQQDYNDLVDRANGPEYDEESIEARHQLATLASTQRMRDGLYREVAPSIREAVVEDLSDQLRRGYENIPEFGYQEVIDNLHHSRYSNAGDWLADTVNGISAIRVADNERKWSDKFTAEVKSAAKEMAEAMTAEQMADYRTKLPNPDTSSSVVDGKSDRTRYANRLELARDIDTILPKIGNAAYRALRESLPEAE